MPAIEDNPAQAGFFCARRRRAGRPSRLLLLRGVFLDRLEQAFPRIDFGWLGGCV